MGPPGALFHAPRWDYQASYPHSPLPEWALRSNQTILLNSVICTGVGMSPSGHEESFLERLICNLKRDFFFFPQSEEREREWGREKDRDFWWDRFKKPKTFQLHESINSSLVIELIWLDLLRVSFHWPESLGEKKLETTVSSHTPWFCQLTQWSSAMVFCF